MSLVAAAVCPHPPLLVPEVAAGAAPELAQLRSACDAAITRVLAARPGLVFLVGPGPDEVAVTGADWGSFAPYGVDLAVRLGPGLCSGRPVLPLSLTVGAWLLGRSGWTGDRQGYVVTPGTDLAARAAEVVDLDDRVALLVLGDGSARRSVGAPGWLDERAEGFDAAVADALARADADALATLDPGLADELGVGGRAAWGLLAAAAAQGGCWSGELLHASAPYGVGYLVATWTRRPCCRPPLLPPLG